MSDEPKEWWKTTPPIHYSEGNPADKLARRQEHAAELQRKSDELKQNPNFLHTNEDIRAFLLKGLAKVDLDAAVGGTDVSEEENKDEAEKLRIEAKAKAAQDVIKYGLGDEDRVALEQLYLGFSQADLIENNRGYRVRITKGEVTQYSDLSQNDNTTASESQNPNLQLAIRSYSERLRGKDLPEQENLVVSPALWNAMIAEFSDLKYISESEQIRKSPSPVFARTAIYGLSIIDSNVDSHTQNQLKVLRIEPINEIPTRVRDFRDFRDNLRRNIKEK